MGNTSHKHRTCASGRVSRSKAPRQSSFDEWLKTLEDRDGAARIDARIVRLSLGNFGDYKPIGEGLSELRTSAARFLRGRTTPRMSMFPVS